VLTVRNVVAYELLSLDGVAEDPNRFITDWDDMMDANLAEVIGLQDAVILGRASYDEWAEFWPGSDVEPFSTFINGVAKYVATSTPLAMPWDNATAIEGDLASFVRDLKAEPGGEIGLHASISVVQHLLQADLVDQLKLVIAPSISGSGRRLLEVVQPVRLKTIRAVGTPSGHLLTDYEVLTSHPVAPTRHYHR
jgi:dihydrofolate reductase